MSSLQTILILCFVGLTFAKTFQLEYPDYDTDHEVEGFLPDMSDVSDYSNSITIGNANQYLDKLLEDARNTFRSINLDPMSLPDVDEKFSKKVLFVNIWGGFSTSSGYLNGLATIHRAGDATLDHQNNEIVIRATLAINNLKVGTNARAYLGKLSIPWYMAVWISYVRATIEIRVPVELQGHKPRATDFRVHDIGKIDITFGKLGPLNWMLKGIGFAVTNLLKNVLKNKINGPILGAINKSLPRIPTLDFS